MINKEIRKVDRSYYITAIIGIAGILIPMIVFLFVSPLYGLIIGVDEGPVDECYKITLLSGDEYYTTDYEIDDESNLHIYDYYIQPTALLFEYTWELEYQDRTFQQGTYTIIDYEGR